MFDFWLSDLQTNAGRVIFFALIPKVEVRIFTEIFLKYRSRPAERSPFTFREWNVQIISAERNRGRRLVVRVLADIWVSDLKTNAGRVIFFCARIPTVEFRIFPEIFSKYSSRAARRSSFTFLEWNVRTISGKRNRGRRLVLRV